eukprot:TRINITY_DN98989_c0_g1_i1.p1 TRINITY_DN98989_c0_g1~~TRINITY_DN98989_c0_g1_i1.p1  ORF type:complete len:349 (-),score=53.06 TRINITY_DN98989_c0_g1_i1:133-1179(-)
MRMFRRAHRHYKDSALALGAAGTANLFLWTLKQPVRAEDRNRTIDILLIRHAESNGNKAAEDERLQKLQKDNFRLFLQERRKLVPDPDVPLSPLGELQAERLRGYGPLLAQKVGEGGKACIFVSPMLRTCQTAAPLVAELRQRNACRVWVKDDIFEFGGMFEIVDGPDPLVKKQLIPRPGLSAKEIRQRFDYDTTLMEHTDGESGWCTGKWESDGEGRERAAAVARWLRSDEFYELCKVESQSSTNPCSVFVSHGWFLNCLLDAVLGIEADHSLDEPDRNGPERQASFFVHRNTGVSRIIITGQAPRRVFVMGLDHYDHLWSTPQSLPGDVPGLDSRSKETLQTNPGA